MVIGLFSLGQAGVGVLFGVGQGMGGMGFAIGQVAISFYVRYAQLALGLYRVHLAMIGGNVLHPWFGGRVLASCLAENGTEDSTQ